MTTQDNIPNGKIEQKATLIRKFVGDRILERAGDNNRGSYQICIISGPYGAGKTTLVRKALHGQLLLEIIDSHDDENWIESIKSNIRRWANLVYENENLDRLPGSGRYLCEAARARSEGSISRSLGNWIEHEDRLKKDNFVLFCCTVESADRFLRVIRNAVKTADIIYIEEKRTSERRTIEEEEDIPRVDDVMKKRPIVSVTALDLVEVLHIFRREFNGEIIPEINNIINESGTLIGIVELIISARINNRIDFPDLNMWIERSKNRKVFFGEFQKWWTSLPHDIQKDAIALLKNPEEMDRKHELSHYGILFKDEEDKWRIPSLIKHWWFAKELNIFMTKEEKSQLIEMLFHFFKQEWMRTMDDRGTVLGSGCGLSEIDFVDVSDEEVASSVVGAIEMWSYDNDQIDAHPLKKVIERVKNVYMRRGLPFAPAQTETVANTLITRAERIYPILKVRSAVGRIENTGGIHQGTGVYIGNGYILTCYHVVQEMHIRRDQAYVRFGSEDNSRNRNEEDNSRNRKELDLNLNNGYFSIIKDYAFIKIVGDVTTTAVNISEEIPTKGNKVAIIHYPGGCSVEVWTNGSVIEESCDEIRHDFQTQGGSSGGAIFNEKWELVAIHARLQHGEAWAITNALFKESLTALTRSKQ